MARKTAKPNSETPTTSFIRKTGVETSNIVMQAARVLDEEVAIGIVAAKKAQERFRKTRSIQAADFEEVLERFQADGNELISVLNDQLERLTSQENAEVRSHFVRHTRDVLALAVDVVKSGVDLSGQIVPKLTGKPRKQKPAR